MKDTGKNTKTLFEEAPVELLSKAIIGDKYYSDLKGRDVYEDSEFTEGKGSRESGGSRAYLETEVSAALRIVGSHRRIIRPISIDLSNDIPPS